MTRITAFSSPFLLGFDEIERALDRVSKSATDGYPPYNIERLPRTAERGETIRITLAVAGFSADELEVTVEENELVVRGRQQDDTARTYLHRGIAARQFQKTFVLAEGIEVIGANLADGLLSIDLSRPLAERVVRRIEINGRGEAGPGKE
jgi:HSP20 family molecular chaperone IbpA